jgi:hypothetical protein
MARSIKNKKRLRTQTEYESNDETLDEITSRYEGEPEDESDFYVLTSPPIKI